MRIDTITPEMIARAPSMVASLVNTRNAGKPLPVNIAFGDRTYWTRVFLGEIIPFNPVLGELAPGNACLDGVSQTSADLSGEALMLLDLATKERLIAPAAHAAPFDEVAAYRAGKSDPVARLRAAGIEAVAVKPGTVEPPVYRAPVKRTGIPREPHPWAIDAPRRQTAADVQAIEDALARKGVDAGHDDEQRRLHVESMGGRSPFAPAAPSSSAFDRETFRDQTGGEPAQVAEPLAKRERRAEA